MKRALGIIHKAIKIFITILVSAMCLIVIWQVSTRFIFNNPSSWSEEISRYLLIWITFLGGSLGLGEGAHIALEVVTSRIKNARVRTIIHIFSFLACAFLGYILVRYGFVYMMSGMKRYMMCCKVPIGYVYAVVPISGVVIIIKSLQIIYNDIVDMKNGTAEKSVSSQM